MCKQLLLEMSGSHISNDLPVVAAVLRGLDLILPRGTITAVVGRSGAGKSTVASLISRFYEPDSGAIWLGGRPASEFSRGEWAKAVALVSQEPVLFSGKLCLVHLIILHDHAFDVNMA